jgi:diadenosine tetraphosphatase ApaH/serine/threonine PP2A family protein phosphatase
MKALISDIHGNLEALRAVVDEIDSLGITEIVCLGDMVGYGPQPRECLDLVESIANVIILGNHEEAILHGCPPNFSPRARRAIEWTRKVLLESPSDPVKVREKRHELLKSLKTDCCIEGVTYVHGSPRSPTREYVLPRDAGDKKKMGGIFEAMKDYCFCGHSHTPGIFTPNGFTHPSEIFDLYMLGTDEKALINVGSVGQPRDGDPRACYVTFDGDTVVWRRVEYNFEAVANKIYAIKELDRFLGDRLKEGR